MKRFVSAVVVCAGVLSASVVSAAPLSGAFRIDGEDNDVRVGANFVDFGPFGNTTGLFEVTTASQASKPNKISNLRFGVVGQSSNVSRYGAPRFDRLAVAGGRDATMVG